MDTYMLLRSQKKETLKSLRYGYTTGACATAASLAAASKLIGGVETERVRINLPRGQQPSFVISYCHLTANGAEAATVKDAGDDPDVTHGALIITQIELSELTGVHFRAGSGVGIVTRHGLPISVGEAAINPIPRRMITEHLVKLAIDNAYRGGFEVTVSVEGGIKLAQKTLNPRLGIVGGLSILGTTGIVRPFSCSAYISAIQQSIDVARANGVDHIAACTGATSEQMIRKLYDLPDIALIEMGDFAGVVLRHLRNTTIRRLSLVGGFGKISKLAAGQLDLHSRSANIDLNMLANEIAMMGGSVALQKEILVANTSQRVLALAQSAGLQLGDRICALARSKARALFLPDLATVVEVWATDYLGRSVGHAGFM
jgi:cobalt-precorrin-5B (C1)-methyltransferase